MPSLPGPLTCFFTADDGGALRSRSVSGVLPTALLDGIPAPPAALAADWARDIATLLQLEPGEVEPLPLARTRMRWPALRQCVQAATDWADGIGLPGRLASAEMALMACRGARYHHDGTLYGDSAFCNLFLSDDPDLDLHFPAAGVRMPLARGLVVLFDTAQPHAVVARRREGFDAADFGPDRAAGPVFLSWELPLLGDDGLRRLLGITLDDEPGDAPGEPQLQLEGRAVEVCPASGRWRDGG